MFAIIFVLDRVTVRFAEPPVEEGISFIRNLVRGKKNCSIITFLCQNVCRWVVKRNIRSRNSPFSKQGMKTTGNTREKIELLTTTCKLIDSKEVRNNLKFLYFSLLAPSGFGPLGPASLLPR